MIKQGTTIFVPYFFGMSQIRKKEALDYHSSGRKGKLEIIPTKPHSSQRDLALSYSHGVAEPVLALADNPDDVDKYSAKGNLVALISNGKALLRQGNFDPVGQTSLEEG